MRKMPKWMSPLLIQICNWAICFNGVLNVFYFRRISIEFVSAKIRCISCENRIRVCATNFKQLSFKFKILIEVHAAVRIWMNVVQFAILNYEIDIYIADKEIYWITPKLNGQSWFWLTFDEFQWKITKLTLTFSYSSIIIHKLNWTFLKEYLKFEFESNKCENERRTKKIFYWFSLSTGYVGCLNWKIIRLRRLYLSNAVHREETTTTHGTQNHITHFCWCMKRHW